MNDQAKAVDIDSTEPATTDFDRFADYKDGDDVVICDRENPKAWIKSDTVSRIDV